MPASDIQHQYVWSASGENAPILRDTYSSGSLVATDRLYYLTDANGNVTAVTDYTGAVQERYSYDAYGNVTYYTAAWSQISASAVDNTLLFAGMQLDEATNVYYDRARWYNPSTGGFITRDPAQSEANLYEYVGNDPIGETDPSGMYPGPSGPTWTPPGPTKKCSPTADDEVTEQERQSLQKSIDDGAALNEFKQSQNQQRQDITRLLGGNFSNVPPSAISQIARKYPSLVDTVLSSGGQPGKVVVSVPG